VWNYALTALTDGETVVPATTVYQAQSGGLLGSFMAQYAAPNGGVTDVGVRVLLSSAGEIQSVSIVDASTGSSAGVSIEVGGTLTPYVFVPSSSSYEQVLSTQSIEVSEALEVDFVRLPAKTAFDMGLVVQDAAGNAATAFASGRVQ
jgi:hypothetical protein